MVLFQNCVWQSHSPTKMATTVQLRCYWKQLWSRWAITGSWEPLVLSNCWLQKSDICWQASYMYTILWVSILDPSDSYFLFADLVGFYTHWTYMHIFHHIFLSNYWYQKSDIWSQALYRYPISWEAFFEPSDSYFLFAKERGYHKWGLSHSSSCHLFFYFLFYLMFSTMYIIF